MKRTYVDIIGEYYDDIEDAAQIANTFNLRDSEIRKVFQPRRKIRRQKFKGEA